MTDYFDLSGRHAIITGGSRGIGKALAKGFHEAGATVAITGTKDSVLKVAEELAADGGAPVYGVVGDIGDRATRKESFEQAVSLLGGKLDILVNNAGINIRGHNALDFPYDEWDRMLSVNLEGLFYTCQLAAPYMMKQGYGKIINLASIAGVRGAINLPVYSMTKHGVVGLTRSLSNDWAKHGIRVNGIAPGFIITEMVEKTLADPARVRHISERIALDRFGQVEDLVGPAIFLAAKASDYMTAQTISVDGGATYLAL